MKSSHATANDAKHVVPTTYYQFLEISVRELLIEKGVLSAEDIRNAVKEMDSRGPELGAQVVARAWVDPQFKQSLLQDAPSAVKTLGLDIGPVQLLVVENTPEVHNLIVCTLCSCYPRSRYSDSLRTGTKVVNTVHVRYANRDRCCWNSVQIFLMK